MNRMDWLLLVLDSGESLSPVQLQKSLFLISKEIAQAVENDFYEFAPYDYGPFDSDIYSDAHQLESARLASIDNPRERGWRRYRITEEGMKKAPSIRGELGDEVLSKLDEIVAFVREQSFISLVRSIYEKYPEYKEKSVFQS